MYLGSGGYGGGLQVAVLNVGTSVIERGCVCSFKADADRLYTIVSTDDTSVDRGQGAGVGPTHLVPVVPWVTITDDQPFGIAQKAIESGKHGLVTILGMAYVQTTGSVVADQQIEVTTGGKVQLFATGTKVGRALFTDWTEEDSFDYGTATDTYTLAIVRFAYYT